MRSRFGGRCLGFSFGFVVGGFFFVIFLLFGVIFCLCFGGFGLSFFVGSFFGAVHTVNETDKEKDDEGNRKKVDDILQKIAECDMGGGVCAEEIRNVDC